MIFTSAHAGGLLCRSRQVISSRRIPSVRIRRLLRSRSRRFCGSGARKNCWPKTRRERNRSIDFVFAHRIWPLRRRRTLRGTGFRRGPGTVVFWTLHPLKGDSGSTPERIAEAWSDPETDFGPLDANIRVPHVVECPEFRGHIAGESGPAAAPFPGGAFVNEEAARARCRERRVRRARDACAGAQLVR